MPPVESPGMELDLRGQVTEEALHHLDQYLDQAFLARLPWVHIIHGKGSGVLRQAVRQELRSHPLITSFRPGQEGEGGEGVTVAKLAIELRKAGLLSISADDPPKTARRFNQQDRLAPN